MVAEVAVTLTSGSRGSAVTVATCIATCIATYIATGVGIASRLAAPCRVDGAGTARAGDPRTRVHQRHNRNALADVRLACTAGTVPSRPLLLHRLDEPLLEAGRPVGTEVVGRRHPVLEPLVHAAQRLATEPHQVCPRHVAVGTREVREAVSGCRPRH